MDIEVRNHGSIFLLLPTSDEGRAWLKEHLPEDTQMWCSAAVVEPRYVDSILDGAVEDGLEVQ